jgi:hypothetical protein
LIIYQTAIFEKRKKKLHVNQVAILDNAVRKIAENPKMGGLKKGDLFGIRVYKFDLLNQQMLLAYAESKKEITLIFFASW